MKNSLYWLGGLALTALLVLGIADREAHADRDPRAESKKSPLRGTWSFSQFVPTTAALGTS